MGVLMGILMIDLMQWPFDGSDCLLYILDANNEYDKLLAKVYIAK